VSLGARATPTRLAVQVARLFVRRLIAVAAGDERAVPIRGTLSAGLIRILVTDAAPAVGLIEGQRR